MMLTGTTKDEKTPTSPLLPVLEQPRRFFSLTELSSATQNFDEKWCIGHGGFGKVYRGVISDGPTNYNYAIKRLHFMSDQGAHEFWVEVEMLSKLRHCNLVSLIGYCNEGKEMALVYEYMPHGTLYDHLHKKGTLLTWSQRLKICIGAARGLDYLHTGTGTQHGIIHRDVKSSNILLDQNYAAKISDFGLAKIGPTNQTHTYVSTIVKGTFGYMDPNYFYTGRLTRKSDVYAFGVVLLEVLCGRPALDESLDEGLAIWAQDRIKQGKLTQIIDSSLRDHISRSSLKEFSRIAARCLLSHPNQRPTMSEVVGSLDLALSFQERTHSSTQRGIIKNNVWSMLSLKGLFENKKTNGGKAINDIVSIPVPTIVTEIKVDQGEPVEGQDIYNDPLPGIENLQINGDAFPGGQVQACGYGINGAVSCMFQWVHYFTEGSIEYIEDATDPTYTVAVGDLGTLLGVQVIPMDENGRRGRCFTCFANNGLFISETVSVPEDDNNDPLPAIENLSIIGDALPGEKLLVCGYSVNGAVSCWFEWVHHLPDGSIQYIEGATRPTYTVALGDVGARLGVEVTPLDKNGRRGRCCKLFANKGLVITNASQ